MTGTGEDRGWPGGNGGSIPPDPWQSAGSGGQDPWGTQQDPYGQAGSGWGASGESDPDPFGQSGGGWGDTAQGDADPFGQPASPAAGWGPPEQSYGGSNPYPTPFGSVPSAAPAGPSPYDKQPGHDRLAAAAEAQARGSSTIIGAIVGGVVLLAGIAVGVLFLTGVLGGSGDPGVAAPTSPAVDPTTPVTDPPSPDPTSPATDPTTPESTPTEVVSAAEGEYGSDPELDSLWDQCEAGEYTACDDLYLAAAYGSAYAEFANTCGETTRSHYGGCAAITTNVIAYAAYRQACEAGDMISCDRLYVNAQVGSEDETVGATCGGTVETSSFGNCATAEQKSEERTTYGSDPAFDIVYDACGSGDLDSCNTLYRHTPSGSDYQTFGSTCGNTSPHTYGSCR